MQAALGEDDATVPNKNRFRFRRPSGQFEFEFRDGNLRVFYCVEEDQVAVDAIGRKRVNQLLLGGRKVTLSSSTTFRSSSHASLPTARTLHSPQPPCSP